MTEISFDYANLSGRPPGPIVTLAGKVLRGVRTVQAQVEPYAHRWEQQNRAALTESGPLWVVLGDSMAQSIGASGYDRGWAGQLAEWLPEHRLINLSFYGGRVKDLLERQIPVMESLDIQPNLVTVIIGSNDVLNRRFRPALPNSLRQLVDRLPPGTVIANQPGPQAAAHEFNRILDGAIEARGLVLAECRDPRVRKWKGKLSADHFHPNDRGYAGMAEIMAEAIARR